MEEALVEALVLVSLITIATVLGSYMAYTSVLQARAIKEWDYRHTASDLAYAIGKACEQLYRPDRPSSLDSVNASVSITGRETVRLEPYGIIVGSGKSGKAVITAQSLESVCSLAAGRRVNVTIVPGSVVGDTIVLRVSLVNGGVRIEAGS